MDMAYCVQMSYYSLSQLKDYKTMTCQSQGSEKIVFIRAQEPEIFRPAQSIIANFLQDITNLIAKKLYKSNKMLQNKNQRSNFHRTYRKHYCAEFQKYLSKLDRLLKSRPALGLAGLACSYDPVSGFGIEVQQPPPEALSSNKVFMHLSCGNFKAKMMIFETAVVNGAGTEIAYQYVVEWGLMKNW